MEILSGTKLQRIAENDDAPITVDLIVHKRGQSYEYGFTNLICVEMKKVPIEKAASVMRNDFQIWLVMTMVLDIVPAL